MNEKLCSWLELNQKEDIHQIREKHAKQCFITDMNVSEQDSQCNTGVTSFISLLRTAWIHEFNMQPNWHCSDPDCSCHPVSLAQAGDHKD